MRNSVNLGVSALVILAAVGGVVAPVSMAQSYPTKPIRLVLGFPPGGGVDVLARQIMPPLSEQLGKQIVVDNRPGAASNIAFELIARAEPDGYSLLLSTPSITVNPYLYRKVVYDPIKDFAPISLVGTTALVVVVNPSLTVKSVKDFIALARAKPGQFSYSSGGNGSAAHLAGELMKSMTGTNIVHVPFKGSPPSLTSLVAGDVHITFGALPSTKPLVDSGRLKALAVTTPKRSKFMPKLPTVSESGLPGYEVVQWYGLLGPAGIPSSIVNQLNTGLKSVLARPAIQSQLARRSIEIVGSSAPEFAAFIKSEIAKWSKVVKDADMRVD